MASADSAARKKWTVRHFTIGKGLSREQTDEPRSGRGRRKRPRRGAACSCAESPRADTTWVQSKEPRSLDKTLCTVCLLHAISVLMENIALLMCPWLVLVRVTRLAPSANRKRRKPHRERVCTPRGHPAHPHTRRLSVCIFVHVRVRAPCLSTAGRASSAVAAAPAR